MRILFVLNNFNIGGPQKSLLSLIHNFPEEQNIDLIVLNNDYKLVKYLPNNVTLLRADHFIPLLMLNKYKLAKNLFFNLFTHPILVFKTLKIIIITKIKRKEFVKEKQKFWVKNKQKLQSKNNYEYDIAVGVSGGHSIMYVSDFVNAQKKVGWIRTEYQNLMRDIQIDSHYFSQMDIVLSVSQKCADKFVEFFPNQKSKVITFYNALPFTMYQKIKQKKIHFNETKENIFIISTISRLDENKGLDLVIDAAKILKQEGVNFQWKIYGVGKLKKKMEKEIHKNLLKEIVILEGFVFNTGEILENTTILVHPSKFEGKSNTIDEAKHYEIPIVSTRFPTVHEQLTDGQNAVITDLTGAALANGIMRLINNENLKNKFKEKMKIENTMNLSRDVFQEFLEAIEVKKYD